MQSTLEERIEALEREHRSLPSGERKQLLFRLLKEEGYTRKEVFLAFKELERRNLSQIEFTSNESTISIEFEGCQRDSDGVVVDPFLLQPIPLEHLVSYSTTSGDKFCFDRRTLYRNFILEDKHLNPFNREVLPDAFVESVLEYGRSLRRYMHFAGVQIVVEPFATLGEVIISLLRSLPGSILDNVIRYNPFFVRSLYSLPLDEESPLPDDSTIEAYPFNGTLERSSLLLNLFNFVRANRSNELYDSLYSYLGGELELSPVLQISPDREFTVAATLTLITVVKEFYAVLGGLHILQEVNLVFSNGESLSSLRLDQTISSQVPSETIYHVPYLAEEEKRIVIAKYKEFAFYSNDRDLMDAIYLRSDAENFRLQVGNDIALVTKGNYTLEELQEYLIEVVRLGAILDRRLLPKLKTLREDVFKILAHELVQSSFSSGTFEIAKAIIVNSRPRLLKSILKRFDLGQLESDLREKIVATISPELVSRVERFFSGETMVFNSRQIAHLDDVSIFLLSLRASDVRSESFVTSCIEVSIKEGGNKIASYASETLSPELSFLGLLNFGSNEQFQRLLERMSTIEINSLTIRVNLSDFVLLQEQAESNSLLLLSDERLTSETLSRSRFWLSSFYLSHPEVWLNLRHFEDWRKLLSAVWASQIPLERRDLVNLIRKLSDEEVEQLREWQLLDLAAEADRSLHLYSYSEALLQAARLSLPFLLRYVYSQDGISTNFILNEVLKERSKEVRRALSLYPHKNNDHFKAILETSFLEQLEFRSLPAEYYLEYLLEVASDDEFKEFVSAVPLVLKRLAQIATNLRLDLLEGEIATSSMSRSRLKILLSL